MKNIFVLCVCFFLLLLFFIFDEEWNLYIAPELKESKAVEISLKEFMNTCKQYSLAINTSVERENQKGKNALLVLDKAGVDWLKNYGVGVNVDNIMDIPREGFLVQTIHKPDKSKVIVLIGGDEIGTAYGIFWLLDRLEGNKTIPEMNEKRVPAFPVRIASAWGKNLHGGVTTEQLITSFRYGFNWVSGMNTLDLVPWNSEPENTRNKENIEKIKPLIKLAHSLGMRYFAFSNELTFHLSLFDNNSELLNPCLPEFWERIKEKYRLLFTALPELDGVEVCLDDISGFWDNYHPFDILHDCPQCPMSYEERYRKYLKTIHEVVVGEFGKIYFHKNWGLRDHEIHCQPEVFRKIFTNEIPVDNLYVMIKITRADRWWFQPYNRTFNLSPHRTIVMFEPMNYYEGSDTNIFPTFSGEFFQNGLRYFLSAEESNVSGMSFLGGFSAGEWSTRSAYVYTLYRLLWEPEVDMKQVARDYCAINFGGEVADVIADILMDTANAYKYGLFIEPIAYGQFNSFPHMRVATFVAEGYPLIDLGKGHIQFLRNIYLQCVPWREFTLKQLHFGHDKAKGMAEKFTSIKDKFSSEDWAEKLENQLNMTQSLIQTHTAYIETMFSYFDYMDKPTEENKVILDTSLSKLIQSSETFKNIPGFNYKLDGVNVLIEHSQRAVEDINAEKRLVKKVPDQRTIDRMILGQQEIYRKILKEYSEKLVKIGHFEILVDGQDLLHIKGDKYWIEHLRWDRPEIVSTEIITSLPAREVLVIPVDISSRPLYPFVLYQPSPKNDFQATIYLDDRPGGTGRFTFALYMIEPEGIDLPIIKNWSEYFMK